MRRALGRLCAVVGLVVATLGWASSAWASPQFDPGDDWTVESSASLPVTASAPECDVGMETVWTSGEHTLTMTTVPCWDSSAAAGMYEWLGVEGDVVPGASEEDELVLWTGDAVTRAWVGEGPSERYTVAVQTITCAGATRDECVAGSNGLVRAAMEALPGGVAGVDTPGYTIQSWILVLLVPGILVGIVVVPFRAIRALTRPRYASESTSPRYHDTSRRVRRAQGRRLVRRFLWWTLAFFGMVAASSITTRDSSQALGAAVIMVIVGVVIVVGRFTFARSDPVERGRRPTTGLGAQAVVGTIVSFLAYATAALLVLIFALTVSYALMSQGWPTLTSEDIDRMALPMLSGLSGVAQALGGSGYAVCLLLLLPALIVVTVIDGFGQGLRSASIDEALAQDDRPHYLYLRSFDEDRLRLAGQLRRRGLLSSLSLLRRVRFEEVMVRQLSTTGPVIAIAPPGSSLPAIGAARASFSNEEWQQHVYRYAETARAVVLSATPGEIRPGYGWELDLIAHGISHQRVMVVLGPWSPSQLRRRWTQFCHAVAQVPFFAPITMPWVPDGVHVLAHSSRLGWHAFGARRRADWTYAVAIDEATRAYLPDWS